MLLLTRYSRSFQLIVDYVKITRRTTYFFSYGNYGIIIRFGCVHFTRSVSYQKTLVLSKATDLLRLCTNNLE